MQWRTGLSVSSVAWLLLLCRRSGETCGYRPNWRNSKTPSLVPLFHEGIPKARCHVRCGWWFGECHRPENSPKIHLAIYWSDRWAHFRCGESFAYDLWQKIAPHQSDDSLFCSRLFLGRSAHLHTFFEIGAGGTAQLVGPSPFSTTSIIFHKLTIIPSINPNFL